MNIVAKLTFVAASCALLSAASAAELRTEHTYRLAEGEARPSATLNDAHWLVGSYTGTAFGNRFEQYWTRPSAGSMVGTFKLLDGDKLQFFELLMLSVDDGTLSLKVKHFNDDFSAWEEKEEYTNFRLVKVEDNALHFGGLSFYRRDDQLIEAYILMRNGDDVREEKLVYHREP